jgi:hypothetical protein
VAGRYTPRSRLPGAASERSELLWRAPAARITLDDQQPSPQASSMRTIRAAVLCLPFTFCAVSCVQSPDDSQPAAAAYNDSEPTEQAEPAGPNPERVGEAKDPWTRADCYTAWKHNLTQCKTPECWALASVLLGVCLKGAEN